ncbi:MAG: hypothetical protein A3H69_04630 [Candidatus Sungbacteria bacterium RIFCSPLOWO2_02_FULL_47_9]|nr:MAG: hypothetical protein A3D57_01735 [Candidatus Sungbacteria bacterium RIFCSPHIGHO2_02_FULL_46_12]OHA11131.1 MAG: hypothetical protein A3H69_04630 [Candidatus Sungbacteria bacterium RIFCSPLOWO2_02_FULL_47_9]
MLLSFDQSTCVFASHIMANDSRSFFERLTGSVKIQDNGGAEEEPVDMHDGTKFTPVNHSLLKRKTIDPADEPEDLPTLASAPARPLRAKGGTLSSARAPVQKKTLPRNEERDEYETENIPLRQESATAEESREEESEVEGQLTVDIYDDSDYIVIQSTVAGVKPEDLDVSITNDMITIRGRRRKSESIREENYYYRELYWGAFSRSVILPEEVESDKCEASLKNGLLSVRLPKKNKNVVQKIRVKME